MNYKTDDIVLASYLQVSDFTMTDIELHGTKGIFVFDNVDAATLRKYDLNQCTVEPQAFNNALRQLATTVRRMQANV